jgi:TolB protein
MTRRFTATGLLIIATLVPVACGNSTMKPVPSAHRSAMTVPAPALGVHAPGIIAFRRYLDSAQATSAIFTIRPDGSHEHQISHPPHGRIDDQPAISADGKRVAFEYCANGADGSCHVIVQDIDGGHPHELHVACAHRPICDPQAPAWGPDGRLAINLSWGSLSADHEVQHSQVLVIDPDGSHLRVVASTVPYRGELNRPVWSPDGARIAYEYDAVTAGSITGVAIDVVSADGGRPRRITPYSLGAGDGIDWSPDGKWIVFRTHADSDDAPTDLNVIHPDGSGRRALTHNGSSGNRVLSSSFSPDGQWIVFGALYRGDPADLFIMHSDGTDVRPLTHTALWDSAPEWGRG